MRAVTDSGMRRFWERRAAEDAFYFVDNRLEYGAGDREAFWAQGERDLDVLLGNLGAAVSPEDAVVEIGCGVGRLTRVLARRAGQVTAVDISPRMLEIARHENAELTNVEWLLGDGVSLAGIDSAAADACVSHVVFQHIPDPAVTLAYVREIGRVLRPAGWAAFQFSNDPDVHRVRERSRGIGARLSRAAGRAPRGQDDPAWLGSSVALADMRRAVEDGGMTIERVEGEGTQYCHMLTRRR